MLIRIFRTTVDPFMPSFANHPEIIRQNEVARKHLEENKEALIELFERIEKERIEMASTRKTRFIVNTLSNIWNIIIKEIVMTLDINKRVYMKRGQKKKKLTGIKIKIGFRKYSKESAIVKAFNYCNPFSRKHFQQ